MNLTNLPYAQMLSAAQNGSPALLRVAGRAMGLGEAERTALANGKIPGWFWALGGVAIGVFAGVRLHRMVGDKLPEWLRGG
jgi:hypothetical protein